MLSAAHHSLSLSPLLFVTNGVSLSGSSGNAVLLRSIDKWKPSDCDGSGNCQLVIITSKHDYPLWCTISVVILILFVCSKKIPMVPIYYSMANNHLNQPSKDSYLFILTQHNVVIPYQSQMSQMQMTTNPLHFMFKNTNSIVCLTCLRTVTLSGLQLPLRNPLSQQVEQNKWAEQDNFTWRKCRSSDTGNRTLNAHHKTSAEGHTCMADS